MKYLKAILVLPAAALIYVPLSIQWATGGWPFGVLSTGPARWLLASIIAVPALWSGARTVILFAHVGRGTLAPWDPPRVFVAEGPYRYTRNPMLTAVVMLVLAEAIALASLPLLGWMAVFFIGNTFYFRHIEEPALERRFGEDYRRYKANVPRWIPRSSPYDPAAHA